MSTSIFMLLANDLSFAVYFILILDHRNDVRQKANSRVVFFLLKIKIAEMNTWRVVEINVMCVV